MKIFKLIGAVIWAIPAYFLWNYLAPIYLPELPAQYLDVPFWHIAGIFALVKIITMLIFPRNYHHTRSCKWGKFRKFKRFHHFAHHGRCGVTETYYHH